MPWLCVRIESGDVHVMPLDDTKPHDESRSCACHPRIDIRANNVVIHNSYDGREIVEQATIYIHKAVN